MKSKTLLATRDVARMLNITPSAVRQLVSRKRLPAVKVGERFLYDLDLVTMLADCPLYQAKSRKAKA